MTAYALAHAAAIPGMLADAGFHRADSVLSGEASAGIFTGCAVKKGASDNKVVNLSTAADVVEGIAIYSDQLADPIDITSAGITPGTPFSILKKGRIYVMSEVAVTKDDKCFVRFATSANPPAITGLGAFRKDADGVAGVLTITPTATNSKVYVLRVEVGGKNFEFEFQASGATSATEIVTGFKTAMAADAEFTALVVATGTTTLILTGQVAGASILAQSEGDGVLAVAITTAPAATAMALPGARFAATAAAGVVAVDFDFSVQ